MIANGIFFINVSGRFCEDNQCPIQIRCLILGYRLVSKHDYGCLAARDEHIVAYFQLFGQNNNVPIDACCNLIFIHILASVIGIKDLFHEHIRNIDNTYHVVESDSFNSKHIAMVKDGAFDLIYRGVLTS